MRGKIVKFDDLPFVNGEDGREWNNAMARYGHLPGCPGIQYEDVCSEPWECASRNTCRIHYEKHIIPWRKLEEGK